MDNQEFSIGDRVQIVVDNPDRNRGIDPKHHGAEATITAITDWRIAPYFVTIDTGVQYWLTRRQIRRANDA